MKIPQWLSVSVLIGILVLVFLILPFCGKAGAEEREYSCGEQWAKYYSIPDKNKGFVVKPDCPKPSPYSIWFTEPEEIPGLSEPPLIPDKYTLCYQLRTQSEIDKESIRPFPRETSRENCMKFMDEYGELNKEAADTPGLSDYVPFPDKKYAPCYQLDAGQARDDCMREIEAFERQNKPDRTCRESCTFTGEVNSMCFDVCEKVEAKYRLLKLANCPWVHMSVSLFAYQGYESPDKYNPRHKYEGQVVEEALNKYPDWTFVHLQWEGEPIDPYFQMTRRGYIIVKKRICQD